MSRQNAALPEPRSRGLPAALFSVALALAGCGPEEGGGTPAAQQQPQTVPVGVIEAQLSPVHLGESFVGRIEAVQKVEVRARVTGFIEARLFEEGQIVEAGTPLFRIEKDTYEAVVQQRRADLAAAEAAATNARAQLGRAETLVERGNVARATVDERRAAAETAEASILQAKAALRQAEINLAYTDIAAPIRGRIGRAAYDVGDLVGPDSNALAEIISQDPIYVVFPVSQGRLAEAEREAAARGAGQDAFTVRIRFQDGTEYPHPGRVDFVGISVDRGTDTVPVRAVLPNPDGRLRDGQFVQARVEQAQAQQAIIIPQRAIQADQQGNFVLAVNPENRVEVRRIQTGETLDRGRVTVASGLQPGDRIIVEGLQRVRSGAPVEPHPAEAIGAGG